MTADRQRMIFYGIWLLLMLVQVPFIELMSDEAYYWCYAQHPDFGYLDHPPMTAFLINIGTAILPGELGVRIVPILLSTAGIYIWERIVTPKNLTLFYTLVVSVGLLHFIGFMAIPDAPLLFFASLFLYQYKRITEEKTKLLHFLLAGLAAGCMLLSKYHGILVIGFVVISNLKLLLNWRFWLAVCIAFIVFAPHAIWQLEHEFLSLQFHLSERSFEPYNAGDTLEYVVTQFFVLGPVVGLLFIWAVVRASVENTFERSLKFIFWGFIGFFFLLSFKGNVEAHWTFITVVPGLYFGYRYLESRGGVKRWLKWSAAGIVMFVVLGRGALMVDLTRWYDMPLFYAEWQSNEARSLRIAEVAGDRPVGFMNSYQKASLYQFYTGKPAFSLNNAIGRRDQFDVWELEQKYIGKDVMIVANYYEKEFSQVRFRKEPISYKIAKNFQYYRQLEVLPVKFKEAYSKGEEVPLKVGIGYKQSNCLVQITDDYPCEIRYHIFSGEELVFEDHFAMLTNQNKHAGAQGTVKIPETSGDYRIQFNIKGGWIPAIRSDRYYLFRVD